MFELSVAWKYLLPKRRQLSVSIISLISIVVISLVIWLILVFFSVTKGLENGWVDKLVTLTAPVRITPTEEYYRSYYYQIDHYSSASDYTFRSIGEKKNAKVLDPYSEMEDSELPPGFPTQDKDKDIVKLAFDAIHAVPGIVASDYEVSSANLRLRLVRGYRKAEEMTQSFLSQAVYIGTFEENSPSYRKILLQNGLKDHENIHNLVKTGYRDESDTKAASPSAYSYYKEGDRYKIPYDAEVGLHGVIAPKSFRDAGVLVGDRGYVSYYAPTASMLQEQRLPIFIAGFYDPGIVPLGGKFLLANPLLVRTIRTAQSQDSSPLTNGINVRFENVKDAVAIKNQLVKELEKRGIAPYFKVETFRDYEYAKDLLQQLSSEKNIFSLISAVIIIVACSNIISMLIILVNDKRTEIGILRSMGASSKSIAMIFGICGIVMGLTGTVIGTILAYFTLQNLNSILGFISRAQGFDAFNPVFYGEQMPTTMSYETLAVVLLATGVISLFAGLIPAVKASQMKPAAILRAE